MATSCNINLSSLARELQNDYQYDESKAQQIAKFLHRKYPDARSVKNIPEYKAREAMISFLPKGTQQILNNTIVFDSLRDCVNSHVMENPDSIIKNSSVSFLNTFLGQSNNYNSSDVNEVTCLKIKDLVNSDSLRSQDINYLFTTALQIIDEIFPSSNQITPTIAEIQKQLNEHGMFTKQQLINALVPLSNDLFNNGLLVYPDQNTLETNALQIRAFVSSLITLIEEDGNPVITNLINNNFEEDSVSEYLSQNLLNENVVPDAATKIVQAFEYFKYVQLRDTMKGAAFSLASTGVQLKDIQAASIDAVKLEPKGVLINDDVEEIITHLKKADKETILDLSNVENAEEVSKRIMEEGPFNENVFFASNWKGAHNLRFLQQAKEVLAHGKEGTPVQDIINDEKISFKDEAVDIYLPSLEKNVTFVFSEASFSMYDAINGFLKAEELNNSPEGENTFIFNNAAKSKIQEAAKLEVYSERIRSENIFQIRQELYNALILHVCKKNPSLLSKALDEDVERVRYTSINSYFAYAVAKVLSKSTKVVIDGNTYYYVDGSVQKKNSSAELSQEMINRIGVTAGLKLGLISSENVVELNGEMNGTSRLYYISNKTIDNQTIQVWDDHYNELNLDELTVENNKELLNKIRLVANYLHKTLIPQSIEVKNQHDVNIKNLIEYVNDLNPNLNNIITYVTENGSRFNDAFYSLNEYYDKLQKFYTDTKLAVRAPRIMKIDNVDNFKSIFRIDAQGYPDINMITNAFAPYHQADAIFISSDIFENINPDIAENIVNSFEMITKHVPTKIIIEMNKQDFDNLQGENRPDYLIQEKFEIQNNEESPATRSFETNLVNRSEWLNTKLRDNFGRTVNTIYQPFNTPLNISDKYSTNFDSAAYNNLNEDHKLLVDLVSCAYAQERGLSENDDQVNRFKNALIHRNANIKSYVDSVLSKVRNLETQLHKQGYSYYLDENFQVPKKIINGVEHYDIEKYTGGLNITQELHEQRTKFDPKKFIHCETIFHNAEIITPDIHNTKYKNISNVTEELFFSKAKSNWKNIINNVPSIKNEECGVLVKTFNSAYSIVFVNDLTSISEEKYGINITNDIRIDEEGYRLDEQGERIYRLPQNENVALFRTKTAHDADAHETIAIKMTNNDEIIGYLREILSSDEMIENAFPLLQNANTAFGITENINNVREGLTAFVKQVLSTCENVSTSPTLKTTLITTNNNLLELSEVGMPGFIKGLRYEMLNFNDKSTFGNVIRDEAKLLYNSFRKALENISTRLPSQALASIQPATTVSFMDSNVNNAYVSRWQLWLQGSDYDIDKTFLMTYGLNQRSGRFSAWSPAMSFYSSKTTNASMELPLPTNRILQSANNPNPGNGKAIVMLTSTQVDEYLNSSKGAEGTMHIVNSINNPNLNVLTPEQIKDSLISKLFSKDLPNVTEYFRLFAKFKLIENIEDYITFLEDNFSIYTSDPIEAQKLIQIKIVDGLLDVINNNDYVVNDYQATIGNELIAIINEHQRAKPSHSATLNYLIGRYMSVLTAPELLSYEFKTIDDALEPFMNKIKNISRSTDHFWHPDDGRWNFAMNAENAAGKSGVGPMANGLKTYFANNYVANKFWNHEAQKLTDEQIAEHPVYFLRAFELPSIDNKGLRVRRVFSQLADVNLNDENKLRLQKMYNTYDTNDSKHISLLFNRGDQSFVFSGLITLAVDNAKTLGLAKINGKLTFISMHVALASLGYTSEEIVNVTSSESFNYLVTAFSTGFDFADKKIPNSRLTRRAFEKIINEAPEKYRKDLRQYQNLFELGNELTQEALLLGINQGVAGTDVEINKKIQRIEGLLNQRLGWFSEIFGFYNNKKLFDVERVVEQLRTKTGINDAQNDDLIRRRVHKVNQLLADGVVELFDENGNLKNIDMQKFFLDKTYQQAVIEIYDVFKAGVNPYYALVNAEIYEGMYHAFSSIVNHLINNDSQTRYLLRQAPKDYLSILPYIDNTEHEGDYLARKKTTYYDDSGFDFADDMISFAEEMAAVFDDEYEYSSKKEIKIRYEKPFTFNEEMLNKTKLLYKQKALCETLKKLNIHIDCEIDSKPYKIDLTNNTGVLRFLQFMSDTIMTLNIQNNAVINNFLSLFISTDTNIFDQNGDNQSLLIPYKGVNSLFQSNILSQEASDTIQDFHEIMNIPITDIIPNFKSNVNLTMSDLFTLYSEILSSTTTSQRYNLSPLLDQLIRSGKSSLVQQELLKTYNELNSSSGRINIDPKTLGAFLMSDIVKRFPRNKFVRFNQDSLSDVDTTKTILYFFDSVLTSTYASASAVALKNALLNRLDVSYNAASCEFTLTDRLNNRKVSFPQVEEVIEKISEIKDDNSQDAIDFKKYADPSKGDVFQKRYGLTPTSEFKYAEINRNNLFTELVNALNAQGKNSEAYAFVENIISNNRNDVVNTPKAQPILSNQDLFARLRNRLEKDFGIHIEVVTKEKMKTTFGNENIQAANSDGNIYISETNLEKSKSGLLVHELSHSICEVLRAVSQNSIVNSYEQMLRKIAPYVETIKVNDKTAIEEVEDISGYGNFTEAFKYEEALVRLIEHVMNGEIDDNALIINGVHLFSVLDEEFKDAAQLTFGISTITNIKDFLSSFITDLPSQFNSSLFTQAPMSSNGYLQQKNNIARVQAAEAYINELLTKRDDNGELVLKKYCK